MNSSIEDVIERAESLADTHLDGAYTTNVTLWDDGDFKVEVVHGSGYKNESILYRSSESNTYPGDTYLYLRGEVSNVKSVTEHERREIETVK